jgi:MurNAc alpha-1-phosphate uridylyltransferase
MKVNSAMIFAAGLGTRMRPLTNDIPKPMVALGNKKLIDYAINSLEKAGLEKIIINTFYKPAIIEEYLKNNYQNNKTKIITIRESERLETGGGLINAKNLIGENHCFTMNSDIILKGDLSNNFEEMKQKFFEQNLSSVLLLCDIKNVYGYDGTGDFYIENCVLKKDKAKNNLVFTGLQLLNIKKVEKINKKIFSLSEFFEIELNENNIGFGIFSGKMLHIGDVSALKTAENIVLTA